MFKLLTLPVALNMLYQTCKISDKYVQILLLFVLLQACNTNKIYEKHIKVYESEHKVEWYKSNIKRFKIDIKDITTPYNFYLAFRYADGYPFTNVKVLLKEIQPDGSYEELSYELPLRDEQGNYIGSPGYDIWDSEHLIIPNKKYTQSGKYVYEITHDMPLNPLPLAMEIGIVLEKKTP